MPLRFTILHHTGVEPEHVDLLVHFPGEPLLRTWRILTLPGTWLQNPPHAARQPDHRQIYLTYEGDISHDRGHVRRLHHGQATLLAESPTSCTLYLAAQNFSSTLILPLAL